MDDLDNGRLLHPIKGISKSIPTSDQFVNRKINDFLKNPIQSDLTTDQFSTLHFSKHKQDCTSTEIAQAYGVGKSTVTAQENRLVEKGYIERMRNNHDRRVVYLHLTDYSEKVFNEVEQKLYEILETYLQPVEVKEMYPLLQSLEQLAQKMENETFRH